jgi:nicotinate-nucleotide adenylyltransferase
LGGSFNPVHFGHLDIARKCGNLFGLSRILFVVASVPPHKSGEDLISFTHRYAMVSLATSDCDDFVPSAIELDPPPSAYSYDTLEKLALKFGLRGKQMYFVAGGDSLLDITKWYRSETILSGYNFIFVMRPGIEASAYRELLPASALPRVIDCRELEPAEMAVRVEAGIADTDCRIFLIQAGAPDIAASRIRRRMLLRQDIDDCVPPLVKEYIQKLHLYGDE